MDAVRLSIDVSHPQALPGGIGLGEAAGEEIADGIRSVQLERLLGTLKAHLGQVSGGPPENQFNWLRNGPDSTLFELVPTGLGAGEEPV